MISGRCWQYVMSCAIQHYTDNGNPEIMWLWGPRMLTCGNKHISQTVHLVLTDSVAHLCLLECEEPHRFLSPRFLSDAGWCGPGLGSGYRIALQILSVSRCCPPWLREAGQQSRFLSVFLHEWRQSLPEHISTAAPETSGLSFHHSKLVKGEHVWTDLV